MEQEGDTNTNKVREQTRLRAAKHYEANKPELKEKKRLAYLKKKDLTNPLIKLDNLEEEDIPLPSNPNEPKHECMPDVLSDFIECLKDTCYWTQLTVGPHMAEKFYQHMLIANLKVKGYENIVYEDVFSYKFEDMNGKLIRIGHGMNARTDVELPDLRILLELKSSNSPTKAEHIAQCRNYLIHRPDLNMGIVINFVSKETADSCPYVQIDVIMKTGKIIKIAESTFELPQFRQFSPICTKLQPCLSEYVIREEWSS